MMKKVVLASASNNLKKGRPTPITVAIFILLIIYTVVLFTPIVWSIIASFMDNSDFNNFFGTLKAYDHGIKYTIDNFVYAWENVTITSTTSTDSVFYIPDLLINSVLYSLGCASAFTICPVIVAYVTARFKYGFSKIVYAFVIVTMALPIVGSMASEIIMLNNLGIFDTFPSVFILRFNFLSIYFLILHAQFSSLPMDYTEAAKIDGASNLRIMFQVIIPQSLNTIVTVFVLSFISYWNDYQIPLLYLPSYPTAAYGIFDFVVQNTAGEGAYVPTQLAATIIMTLPIIIVFIIVNKRIRVSVAMGGIKS